jgi:hypothetical protein
VLIVSWDNVDSWPLGIANPSFMQIQLNLTTGGVTIVWQQIDNDPSSQFGSGHLVGYTPAGLSIDAGSLDLSAVAPFATAGVNVPAPTLSASPAPISSASSGAVVTYTTANMVEYATGSGVYLGLNILSVNQVANGVDLAFLGAPGCLAYVGTVDLPQTMVGVSPTNSVTLPLPTGVTPGVEIFSQSVCLITPNSLPNGQNAFGMIVSNAVRSYVSSF